MKIEGNVMEIARDHYKNSNVAYKEVDLVCKNMKQVMKGVRRGTELSLAIMRHPAMRNEEYPIFGFIQCQHFKNTPKPHSQNRSSSR